MENKMIHKLTEKIKKTNAPIVVGLDPMLKYNPAILRRRHTGNWVKPWKGQRKQSGSLIKKLLTIPLI